MRTQEHSIPAILSSSRRRCETPSGVDFPNRQPSQTLCALFAFIPRQAPYIPARVRCPLYPPWGGNPMLRAFGRWVCYDPEQPSRPSPRQTIDNHWLGASSTSPSPPRLRIHRAHQITHVPEKLVGSRWVWVGFRIGFAWVSGKFRARFGWYLALRPSAHEPPASLTQPRSREIPAALGPHWAAPGRAKPRQAPSWLATRLRAFGLGARYDLSQATPPAPSKQPHPREIPLVLSRALESRAMRFLLFMRQARPAAIFSQTASNRATDRKSVV